MAFRIIRVVAAVLIVLAAVLSQAGAGAGVGLTLQHALVTSSADWHFSGTAMADNGDNSDNNNSGDNDDNSSNNDSTDSNDNSDNSSNNNSGDNGDNGDNSSNSNDNGGDNASSPPPPASAAAPGAAPAAVPLPGPAPSTTEASGTSTGGDTRIALPGDRIVVQIFPWMPQGITVTVRLADPTTVQAPPGSRVGDLVFRLEARGPGGETLTTLPAEVNLSATYTDSEVAGLNEPGVTLFGWTEHEPVDDRPEAGH